MEKYKYLSQCEDFKLLLNHYSTEQMQDFERTIKEYEESADEDFERKFNCDYYGHPDIIVWYEGAMTTVQLFDFVESDMREQK